MKRNTKIIKIFSKKLKRKQRKYTAAKNKLLKCTGNIKKIWNVMKHKIGKSKIKSINLPLKFTINKAHVYNKTEIADGFNYFFRNISQKLASQIPKSSETFETYINEVNVIMNSKPLLINELKDALFSFTNISQKLASQIPKSTEVIVIMNSKPLSLNELKAAFFSLKINERSDADDISFNIIKKCFEVLCEP